MSRDQNIPTKKKRNIQIVNKFFEKAEIFQIFRKTVTYLLHGAESFLKS